MTAAKQCKSAGFTLAELARATGESRETLNNWSVKRPIVFGALLFWAKSKQAAFERGRQEGIRQASNP